MNRKDDIHWQVWLAAEATGRDEDAERALAALWARVERPAPRRGFSSRVLRRLPVRPGLSRGGLWALALAFLSFASLAFWAFLLGPALLASLSRPSLSTFLAALASALIESSQGFAELLVTLAGWGETLRSLAVAAGRDPGVAVTASSFLLLGFGLFAVLNRLLERGRGLKDVRV